MAWAFHFKHENGSLSGIAFQVYRKIDDGTGTLLKTQDQFTYNAQSGWNNGAGGVNITYIDTPKSIGKLTYYLQWHVEQSGTFYINYNDGSTKDGIAAQAMEIRQ